MASPTDYEHDPPASTRLHATSSSNTNTPRASSPHSRREDSSSPYDFTAAYTHSYKSSSPAPFASAPPAGGAPARPAQTATHPAKSSSPALAPASPSSKKKAPPPLSLRRRSAWEMGEPGVTSQGAVLATGDASETERAASGGAPASLGAGYGYDEPPTRWGEPTVSQKDEDQSEERDKIGQLFSFPTTSPLLDFSLSPNPALSPDTEEADADDEFGEGDGEGEGEDSTSTSYLSSSAGAYDGPSSLRNNYTGLGLGLPFSVSAAADLSSLAGKPGKPTRDFSGSSSGGGEGGGVPLSPSGGDKSSTSLSGPESPVTDRSKLVGLGELATPRWTSAALDKTRWGKDEDDFDLGASYASARKVSLPTSTSIASLLPTTRTGLIDFTASNSSTPSAASQPPPPSQSSQYGTSLAEIRRRSSAYSLDAGSADDDLSSGGEEQGGKEAEVPRRYAGYGGYSQGGEAKRKSIGSSASAPNSASLGGWGAGVGTFPGPAPRAKDGGEVVGLGFESSLSGSLGGVGVRRISASSVSSRRSSAGRPLSTADKSPRIGGPPMTSTGATMHHRRQSASKSGFAHLPPSPAASSVTHPPTVPDPLPVPTPVSATANMSTTPTTTSTPISGRTPDLARASHQSFPSHQSSPSFIAANILRQTRDLEFEGLGVGAVEVPIEDVAAVDEGTAEALRKLDGLSSPRLSKTFSASGSSFGLGEGKARSRSSTGEGERRRRTRSSTGGSSVVQKDVESAMASYNVEKERDKDKLGASPRPVSSSASASSPRVPTSTTPTTAGIPRSPLSPQLGRMSAQYRPPSSDLAASSTSTSATGSSSPFKRASSSATSTSIHRDSTSSAISLANRSANSASQSKRRGSVSSDVSSIHSSGATPGHASSEDGVDSSDNLNPNEVLLIPPVPPIPKDWESYRPSTAGTSSSSAQNSPRLAFDPDRRPSDASEYNGAHLSPKAPDMETSLSSSSSVISNPPSKTPTRKWSISGAFGGKSKSPKPPSIKESTSYSDLTMADRGRDSTFGSHLANPAFPKRMAASTNDIAGLVQRADDQPVASTKPRGSLSGKSEPSKLSSSFMSRSRTESMSSSSTTRTASASIASNAPPPSLVATSPGRSRSSLLSPRRTPSGIPFFSRKGSTGSVSSNTSPNLDTAKEFEREKEREKSDSEPAEKSGRKSILGLNFLRSTSSKKDKEKTPPSPTITKRQAFTSSTTTAGRPTEKSATTDEFGRRAGVAAKTTSLMGRKRGKTVGALEEPQQESRSPALPPMQMSALSATTVKRVDSLSSKSSASSSRLQTPRTAKLQESVKGNLPPIAGSPSTHVFPSVQDKDDHADQSQSTSPSGSPPPKSHTPTKIPRLHQRNATVTSPRLTPRVSDSSLSRTGSPPVPSKASRRLSYFGATPDTNPLSQSLSSSTISAADTSASEFGATREPGLQLGEKTLSTRRRLDSEPSGIPRSKSIATVNSLSAPRAPLESSTTSTASVRSSASALPRASRRASLLVGEDAKAAASQALSSSRSSTAVAQPRASVASLQAPRQLSDSSMSSTSSARRPLAKSSDLNASTSSSRRVSAVSSTSETLSSSKSSRTLSTKVGIPTRMAKSSTTGNLSSGATDSGRSSAASSYAVSEEELRGDEEMSAYVRRQQAKKAAAGVSPEVIRKMFEFPDPTEPLPGLDYRDALELYGRYLSDYEKEEITEYDRVYFFGEKCEKKQASKDHPTNNFGYDDDRGDYLLVPHDHIRFRYEVIDVLGKGSFGQVLQCRDHRTGEMVAIKIIRNKKRFHHQALVEIKVLENLVKWDPDEKHFVIRMVDSFTFRGHLCIVTELLSINLYELVKANSFAGFTTTLIRRFTMQILGSLILLRHHRVVHCDLKPENILLKHPAKSAIKVIDFGSSCFEHEKVYTYIQSRFYRSPEVILGMNYHMAIDMWSLGCIIAEMYTGYPIFPGENEQEQLACIMEVMGVPEKYLIDRSNRKRLFFDSTGAPRPVVNSKGRRRRVGSKTLAQVLKSDDELFVDFIAKCLTWDPDRRLKPEPAMRHPWIVAARARSPTTIPPRATRTSTNPSSGYSSSTSVIST
ncbi:dual-specificity tyrosine-(Y)-phosphorylation regulated kinase [Pseudohyphozyma bogoriensis]|nr:dual-specificity tyrosine-(Y)-phosphorylation regulated kinase [Pseudohyphozyma bogoriensis]